MSKKHFDDLKSLIDFLRANGVQAYKGAALDFPVELVLLEQKPLKPEKESKDEPVAKRRGRDGLTAEEQRLTYGHVKDAEE